MPLLSRILKAARPKSEPLRAYVATKQESLAAAVRRINLHNQLRKENATLPRREPLLTPRERRAV